MVIANRLKAHGFRVLGIGDADWGNLDKALRGDLAEYCRADLACYSGNEELLARYAGEIVLHMPMDSKVMGDYAYLVLTETQERRRELLAAVSELRG